jgi:hypothetical protein
MPREVGLALQALAFAGKAVLLWPMAKREPPRLLARIGHVTHWLATGLSALFLIAIARGGNNPGELVAAAVAFLAIGRIVRYILAAE